MTNYTVWVQERGLQAKIEYKTILGIQSLPNGFVETVDRKEDKKVADDKKRLFKPTDCEEVYEKSRKRQKI